MRESLPCTFPHQMLCQTKYFLSPFHAESMAPGDNSTVYTHKKWGVVAWAIFINYIGRDSKPKSSSINALKNPFTVHREMGTRFPVFWSTLLFPDELTWYYTKTKVDLRTEFALTVTLVGKDSHNFKNSLSSASHMNHCAQIINISILTWAAKPKPRSSCLTKICMKKKRENATERKYQCTAPYNYPLPLLRTF